jgi:tRNA threonylcarbamoyladenosine biosynthesis protein TsaE
MPGAFLAEIEVITASPGETMLAGEKLGGLAPAGTVIALRGNLGAGKTCLTRGIARGLGVEEGVTSPTYTIISEYEGRLPLYHMDAYRLSGDEDAENLGLRELFSQGAVTVIEWSERIPGSIPREAWIVELEILDGEKRCIRINAPAIPQEAFSGLYCL